MIGSEGRSVLVAHPGLQHSHQLALALHDAGLLQGFWSGTPIAADQTEAAGLPMPAAMRRKVRLVPISAELRRHPVAFQMAVRLVNVMPDALAKDGRHVVFHMFDNWVARRLRSSAARVVVGYENSAYQTFKTAKAMGALCVLDAPALHHLTAARLACTKPTWYEAEINRRKDAEIELADIILTCSPFAAASYAENGVPKEKLHSLVLGADVGSNEIERFKHLGPPRFIFAGSLRWLKSIDLIADVFHRISAEGGQFDLRFVGGAAERHWIKRVLSIPNASYLPAVPQRELFEMFANSDCLLLPSRFDSFGMVAAEAMSCGTPVIVSNTTGAKTIIERHPRSGWTVSATRDSLYDRVTALLTNPAELESARPYAAAAGREFSWGAYRRRAAVLFHDLLERGLG